MPSGAVTVGGLVVNLAAETSQLKTDMAEGARAVEAGAKSMINSMTGVTESTGRATDAGTRMVRQLQEEIATFGMSSQELLRYKANLNGVGGEVETLMQRLNAMKSAQAGYTDQLAASEAAATQRIKDMVAASMAEVAALNDVATATQGVTNAQAAAISTGRTLAETQRLQILNMQGVAASMKTVQEGTVAMSADTQRILAQYDPLGAKLRSLQADLVTLRKEMGNSVDPAAIKAFQGLENEIAKTQTLMAQAAAQANALGGSTAQLTLTQTQLIERFRQQAETVGMSRSQLMAYQAAQAGVTEQTKDFIAKIKEQEDALKKAAQAKEQERNATDRVTDALKLLAAGYAALKVGEYIKDATMLAARYETLDVVMGVVGRTAGYTKTQMDATAQAVAKQGITLTESRNNVIKLVQAHVDLSNATALARIAQDAAVIGNINSSEAFERLVNGVARGNVLILRNIGINVNLQTAYQQMAASLGKSTLELTENERVQARLNAVLERGTDIAGTYEAAMDTASKQITSMKRYTEDLKTTIGEVFTEVLTVAVMGITEGLKDANGEINELSKNGALAEWGDSLTKVFVGVVNTIDNILTGAKMAGTWAAHWNVSNKIDAQYRDKYNAPGADKAKVRLEWAAALAQEQQQYEEAQTAIAGAADRIERAADERIAARRAKQKAAADERLKVDQDYAARSQALLIANAGKSLEIQQAAQVKLAKEIYQGTANYRDSGDRPDKPKVDQADNSRLQDHLARIEKEAAAEKQNTEQLMKLDAMRHKAGELLDDEYYARRREGISVLALIDADMYAKQIAALRGHHNSTQAEEAKNQKAIHDIIDKQTAANNKAFYDQQADDEEARLRTKKLYDDAVKATLGEGASTIKGLDDQIEKQREHNAEIGKTKEQIELAKQAQVDLRTAQLQSDADYLRDGLAKWDLDQQSRALFQIRLNNLDEEIKRRRMLAGLLDDGANAEAIAAASKELDKYLDPTKAENFGKSFKKGLDGAARSLVELTSAMMRYGEQQAANDKARAEAQILLKGNEEARAKGLKALDEIDRRSTQQQLNGYGNMASAAAGFFSEHSRGYQALTTVSQVFHAAELAMTTAELVPKAISAVLSQGQGDPYTAFGRMTAMAAIVAGLGVAIGGIGGGHDTTAADRQKANGTGSILGDKDAKSESIARSLDAIEKAAYQDLAINSSMLTVLRSIDSGINGVSNLLFRTEGFSTEAPGTQLGSAASFATSGKGLDLIYAPVFGRLLDGLTGGFLSKIAGKVSNAIFGGNVHTLDTGITLDKGSLAQLLAGGVNVSQYADTKKDGGWFHSDKYSTVTADLGKEIDSQFTLIFGGIHDAIVQGAAVLGISGDAFNQKLDSFVVDIGKISTKDMKPEDVQKALQTAISKVGDDLAKFAVDGLQQFQNAGEGALETLTRIATEYQTVDVVFASFGKTFGQVGLASVAARDRLIDLAGGLDKFTSQGEYFLSNFFSEKEQAAALKKRIDPTLAQYGLSTEGEGASKALRDFIVGLDTTTESGAQAYTALMAIAPAFKQIVDAGQDVLDERKDLQGQLDELTMSYEQKMAKQRDALDASNRALFDQVHAQQVYKDALDLQGQIAELAGDKAGAAAVLHQQHAAALLALDPALREATQKLWNLQEAAKATDQIKGDATTLFGVVDSMFSVLQKVVEREKKAVQVSIDAHTASVSKLQSLSQALHSTFNSIQSPDQKLAERAVGQSQIRAALAIARAGGPLPDADKLKDALSAVQQDASNQFSSYTDYLRDLYKTQIDIGALAGLTDDSLSVEQQALDNAKEQLKSLDSILSNAQDQIDELKGQSTTLISIAEGVAALSLAIKTAKANPVVAATSGINGAYQQYLGRVPDAAGLAFWQNQAAAGASASSIKDAIAGSAEAKNRTSIAQLYEQLLERPADDAGLGFFASSGSSLSEIAAAIKTSDEYKKLHPFAIGTNFVPETMPALVHKGERIIPAGDNQVLMRMLSNPTRNSETLAAAVERLTATVARQNEVIERQGEALEQTQRNTRRLADTIDLLSEGGKAVRTKEQTT